MFHVPKRPNGHPRLVLGLMILACVAGVSWAGWTVAERFVDPPVRAADVAPLPPRPPVETVEDLPLLAARLRADPGFMGGVLVARGDRVLFRQVYGPADADTGAMNALDSRFRLASLSKQFTAAAILKLQDEGRLTIGDPVCRWIQPCPDSWAPIRVHHLISHTHGLPDLMARPNWGLGRVTPITLDKLTEDSKAYRPGFIPGGELSYSNAGFNLAAAVVEAASGQAFADYLDQALFQPLGMADTGLGDAPGIVAGHADFAAGLTPQRTPNVSVVTGAGALYSTLDDMLVWQRALHRGHVLSAYSYAQMIADHSPPDRPDARRASRRAWGYGLFVNDLGARVAPAFHDRQIYHTGSWSGFRNLVTYQRDADVTVIVFSNNYHRRDQVLLVSQQAMAEALGRPFPTALAR